MTFLKPILLASAALLTTPGRLIYVHNRSRPALPSTVFETSWSDLTPDPIEPGWIKRGSPMARSVTVTESPDRLLTAGRWDCTAGTFTWIFKSDEIVHILEGEVCVHCGGTAQVLVPGSVAYFPRGLETVWEVGRYVKKQFVLRGPRRSPIRRSASAVKQALAKFIVLAVG